VNAAVIDDIYEDHTAELKQQFSPAQLTDSELNFRIRSMPVLGRSGIKRTRPRRIAWGPIRARQQAQYDLVDPHSKSLKKLWASVGAVRSYLTRTTDQDQSALNRSGSVGAVDGGALNGVTGVIYAIYCSRTTKLYIGQTVRTASARFESHINAALRGENEPFLQAVRRFGWRNFSCFPLEIIPKSKYNTLRATKKAGSGRLNDRARAFRMHATPRELFWMARLHTYQPKGLNTLHQKSGSRTRVGRCRYATNPMKHARAKMMLRQLQLAASSTTSADNDVDMGYAATVAAAATVLKSRSDKTSAAASVAAATEIVGPVSKFNTRLALAASGPLSGAGVGVSAAPYYRDLGVDLVSDGGRWYGSRDWLRRLMYLAIRITRGTFNSIHWDNYTSRSLWGMIHFAEKVKPTNSMITDEHREVIVSTLRHILMVRPSLPTKRVKQSSVDFIRIEWTSDLHRRIALKSILLESEIKKLMPSAMLASIETILIAKKLTRPIGGDILNFSSVARLLPKMRSGFACECRQLFDSKYRMIDSVTNEHGCVRTGDVTIINHLELRRLMTRGPRFRERSKADPLTSVKIGLDQYIRYHVRTSNGALLPRDFAEWRRMVINRCGEKLNMKSSKNGKSHYENNDNDTPLPVLQQPEVRKYLQFLQRHLVFVPMDKASNNIAFICKSLYVDTLQKEFSRTNGAYVDVPLTVSSGMNHNKAVVEIMVAQREYLGAGLLGDAPYKLPYMYGMPKFHKIGNCWRFIAGSRSCSTTFFSKILSDFLLKVMRSLREKDNAHILRTGVRRYFIVESSLEVASFLGRWRRQLGPIKGSDNKGSLRTGDFSTMYTTIPHTALLTAIDHVIKEAFNYEMVTNLPGCNNIADMTIVWSKLLGESNAGDVSVVYKHKSSPSSASRKDSTTSTTSATAATASAAAAPLSGSKKPEVVSFTHSQLLAGVRFLLDNIYIVNGQQIRKQVIGLPMGTNCAPSLANLFLYFYESGFIDRLCANKSDLSEAAAFHMTFRYIDDTLSIDNPFWVKAVARDSSVGGMYPAELLLNDTTPVAGAGSHSRTNEESEETDADCVVHFIGMDVISANGSTRFQTGVFDKRAEFPFPVRRYPHMESLLPSTILYGVFLGELHRGYRSCSAADLFVDFAVDVGKRLVVNGCRKPRLLQLFISFVKRFVSKYHSMKLLHLTSTFKARV
jgi:hypothetical protein